MDLIRKPFGGTYAAVDCSLWMSIPKDVEKRDRKIDEALKETFPASDTPTFVGGVDPNKGQGIVKDERGQEQAADKKRAVRNK